VVAGRVIDAESGAGLQNAVVTLDGHDSMLSSRGGGFRFVRVRSGDHPFRVAAVGYKELVTTIEVNRDTLVVVPLEIQPIELEGLSVVLGKLDFDGRVRDPRTNSHVFDADVRSGQGHRESTDLFGRFELDDVFKGPPLRLVIRAFRYMPLDTTFIPDDEERHPFDLVPDPVMTRLIDTYVARLDDRAGERIYKHQPALNRDDLAEFPANTPLLVLMEREYPRHVVGRIGCLILDEREYRFGSQGERISVLEGTFANELERIEILEFPGYRRLFMARVYTRSFFERRVLSPEDLARPSMVRTPAGMLCG